MNITKELEALTKALELAGTEPTVENATRLEACGYLTINTGHNGRDYAWYMDENYNIAVDIETLDVLSIQEIEQYLA